MANGAGRALRIVVLGAAEGYYAKQLVSASRKSQQPLQVDVQDYRSLQASTEDGRLACLEQYDGCIARSMPPGSLEHVIFRMDCLHGFHDSGRPVVNSPRCLETAIDKWLTLARLARLGIPVPNTVACQTRDAASEAFRRLGGDVVVKSLFGGEGRGMMRVESNELALRVFNSLDATSSVLYLQEFLPHFGYDIRILFVGDRAFAIKRFASQGWITNVAQGGRAEAYTPSDGELDLARRAAAAVDGSVVGVDLLPTKQRGTVVLEVNAVPGWKANEQAHQVDMAELVLRYTVDQICRAKK